VVETGGPAPSSGISSNPQVGENAVLYLVDQDTVVSVRRYLPPPVSVLDVVAALSQGPTVAERRQGLRTALVTPLNVGKVLIDHAGNVTLALKDAPPQVGAAEQVLVFAQLVLTVTSLPGLHTVRLTLDGAPLAVPRSNGSLTTQPLDRRAFLALVVRR
jgi:spore germination protein GerM